jgi:hypothetical protein
MTQFGKRNAVRSALLTSPESSQEPDVDAALAVVNSGKLPSWTTLGPIRLVFILLFIAVGIYFVSATYAKDLLRDIRLSGTWQAAYDLRAVDGSCKRYNFVVTFCSAKIQSIAEPNQAPITSEFMMLLSSGGGELLAPVRSTKDRAAVAIAYAAETKLTNRTLSFVGVFGGLAVVFVAAVNMLAKGRYQGGAAHRTLIAGIVALQRQTENTPTA